MGRAWIAALAAAGLLVVACTTGQRSARTAGAAPTTPVESPTAVAPAAPPPAPLAPPPVEFLGAVEFPHGTTFEHTPVGGLSGLTYDAPRGVYYAISDDHSEHAPARFYTLTIDLVDGRLDAGDVVFTGVTTLLDASGAPFAEGAIDAEGIAAVGDDVYVSSEGDVGKGVAPFIRRFGLDGRQRGSLPLPGYYLPDAAGDVGIRDNLAFESLTVTPDGGELITATENALVQDGPAADVGVGSPARILVYDLATGTPVAEAVYRVGPVPKPPLKAGDFRVNGLAELLALDRGHLLALERAFAAPAELWVRLYRVSLAGATDVFDRPRLSAAGDAVRPVEKTEVVDLGRLLAAHGVSLDNLEGMALAPPLPDGRRPLIVVADDNFSITQRTLFVAVALPPSL